MADSGQRYSFSSKAARDRFLKQRPVQTKEPVDDTMNAAQRLRAALAPLPQPTGRLLFPDRRPVRSVPDPEQLLAQMVPPTSPAEVKPWDLPTNLLPVPGSPMRAPSRFSASVPPAPGAGVFPQPQQPSRPWQRQAAEQFSYLPGRSSLAEAMNAAPPPGRRLPADSGIPRDPLAEGVWSLRQRMGRKAAAGRPRAAKLTKPTLRTAGSPIPPMPPRNVYAPTSPTEENPDTPEQTAARYNNPVPNNGESMEQARARMTRMQAAGPYGGDSASIRPAGLFTPPNITRAVNDYYDATPGAKTGQGPDTEDAVRDILARSPERQFRNAFRPRTDQLGDDLTGLPPMNAPQGTGLGYYQGRSGEPGMYARNQNLGSRPIGAGLQSTGMTGGGVFGSALMMGPGALATTAMGATPQDRPAIQSRPMIGSPGGGASNVTPEQFKAEWDLRARSNAHPRQTATRFGADLTDEQQANRSAYAEKLAGRQERVQENALQRAFNRQQRMAGGGVGDGGQGDQFESYLANVAQYGNDPRAAAEAAKLLMDSRTQRQHQNFAGRQQLLSQAFESARDKYKVDAEKGWQQERTGVEKEKLGVDRQKTDAEIEAANAHWVQVGIQTYQQARAQGLSHAEAVDAATQASNGKWKYIGQPQTTLPGQTPPGDTPLARAMDQYEASTGVGAVPSALAYGAALPLGPVGIDLVRRALPWAIGSDQMKAKARERQSAYAK